LKVATAKITKYGEQFTDELLGRLTPARLTGAVALAG
jgi:hypothetical protein